MSISEHYFIDSSFIKHIHWYQDTSNMIVTFATDSVWIYYNVPEEIFIKMTKAQSVGSVFNKEIRNKYQAEVLFKLGKTSNIIYSKGEEIVQEA
jgi:hypothetical protein